MDDHSVFDFSQEISGENRKLFIRVRLLSVVGLLLAMLAAALFIG